MTVIIEYYFISQQNISDLFEATKYILLSLCRMQRSNMHNNLERKYINTKCKIEIPWKLNN